MNEPAEKEWTLAELFAETRVPARTIRFWISRGLVDPPLRAGRGAAYGRKHKDRILAVRALQEKGLMLDQIRDALAPGDTEQTCSRNAMRFQSAPKSAEMLWFEKVGSPAEEPSDLVSPIYAPGKPAASPVSVPGLPEPEIWRTFVISPDVVVMFRAGAAPWRTKRVMNSLRRFAVEVKPSTSKEDQGE